MKKIVIIGNGISGITAARHIRKLSDHQITIISAETDHFFSRTALMYIYMGHMKYENTKPYEDWFWKKNRIDLLRAYVEKVDFNSKSLQLANGDTVPYDDLILATGSKSNKFGWPGQDLKGVQGLYNFQDLESMEEHTQGVDRAVVVGGGLIGVEMVEMLMSRNIKVTFLVREPSFWNIVLPPEESDLINRHILEHHVDLRLSTELKEILADDDGRARAVITNEGEEIKCQFVGLTVGVSPNVDFLRDSELELDRGILVNEYLETNIPNVYALGDCAQFRQPFPNRRPIEQVWYTGRMMGEAVSRTVCDIKTAYKPGIWFNSAKFFDIEYQTYGHVWSQLKENEDQFYWEHDSGKKCIKFVFDKNDRTLLGINTFGIRLRHEVFNRWLSEKRDVNFVLENLREANFDPEFFKRHEEEIVESYNAQHPENQVILKKGGLLSRIFA
ncbi:FAD-dependent oxidoreductase [Fulvivirgaceae bacterium BMA10]|uniref:FAD-dependent oxidoreductase n=1 Tax=Splendidivirga corallicola TaxID=3051826 RepID=A0ABT8KWR8_9BACT|nr:FAD-dependent oxidoreductase [Fulvivirgaceae bacterium BMA10]